MTVTRALVPGVLLASLLVACGGDEAPPPPDSKVQSFRKDPAADSGGGSSAEDAAAEARTREEMRRKHLVEELKRRFETTRDEMDRADIVIEMTRVCEGHGEAVRPELVEAMESDDPDLKAAGLKAAAKLLLPAEARARALLAFRDDSVMVRRAAVASYAEIPDSEVRPLLDLLLEEIDGRVLGELAKACAFLAKPEDAGAVRKALDGLFDMQAARPLIHWAAENGQKELVPTIVPFLQRDQPETRSEAAKALAKLGVKDKEVLEALVGALRDDEPSVRKDAHAALRQLTGRNVSFDPDGKESERAAGIAEWQKAIGG